MSETRNLRTLLDDVIRARGPIPFYEYMDLALYHPQFGYYSSGRDRVGLRGDFYTSANLDPAMGQLLARLFRAMSEGVDDFGLVEIGAGTGLLARHILDAGVFPYAIVERSASMRARQRQILAGFEVVWLDAIPDHYSGCVFSNEFFDALPVRRFTRKDGRIHEIFVGEGLVEVESDPEPPIELPLLEEGATADVAPDAMDWVGRIGGALERGYHLAIDYGHSREEMFARRSGTLMCYQSHRADENPYADPGEKDMTSHVNFSDLVDRGRRAGLDLVGIRSQKDFLIDLGLLEVMRELAESGSARSVGRIQRLKNLILPQSMGERFRVLLQRKGLPDRPLPGFGGTVSAS